jgi:hypothetical protein
LISLWIHWLLLLWISHWLLHTHWLLHHVRVLITHGLSHWLSHWLNHVHAWTHGLLHHVRILIAHRWLLHSHMSHLGLLLINCGILNIVNNLIWLLLFSIFLNPFHSFSVFSHFLNFLVGLVPCNSQEDSSKNNTCYCSSASTFTLQVVCDFRICKGWISLRNLKNCSNASSHSSIVDCITSVATSVDISVKCKSYIPSSLEITNLRQ